MDKFLDKIDLIIEGNMDQNIKMLKRTLKRLQAIQNEKTSVRDLLWMNGLQSLLLSCFIDNGVDKKRLNKIKGLINQ